MLKFYFSLASTLLTLSFGGFAGWKAHETWRAHTDPVFNAAQCAQTLFNLGGDK